MNFKGSLLYISGVLKQLLTSHISAQGTFQEVHDSNAGIISSGRSIQMQMQGAFHVIFNSMWSIRKPFIFSSCFNDSRSDNGVAAGVLDFVFQDKTDIKAVRCYCVT